jgi:leucyl aminopeptidase
MKIDLSSDNPLKHSTPALVIGCFQDSESEHFTKCNSALDGCLQRLAATGEFTGKVNSTRLLDTLGRLPAERLLLVGLGKKKELDAGRLRQAAGSAVQALRGARVASFTMALHLPGDIQALDTVCEGALLGSYSFDEYKTRDRKELFAFSSMTLLLSKNIPAKAAGASVKATEALLGGVSLTRNLVSHPGNVVTTCYLATAARGVAKRHGLPCRVLEPDDLEQLGMNALLAVGKGSAEPPRLIVLEYNGGGPKERPLALVGKGITFDSGGISIKPAAGMEEMKTDMSGAAAVLGAIEAAASLKLPVNLVGVIPTAENMPDGQAYKPGDVITTMSGLTVEITNTDAEGRLILCDALHYAKTKHKPSAMIDLATLTGACVVALGHEASGMMGNDRRLMDSLKKAGERCGEHLWELPLWDEYGETMKSDIADLRNAGTTRDGGTITAGWFLKQFVGTTRWVHLDIAGTAWTDKSRPCSPKGATGVGVRLLIEYLRGR